MLVRLKSEHARREPVEGANGRKKTKLKVYRPGEKIEVTEDEYKRLKDRMVPVDEKETKGDQPLNVYNMTKAKLFELAKERGIEVDETWKINKLRQHVSEALAGDAPAEDDKE